MSEFQNVGIYVGTSPQTIKEVTDSILKVLNTSAGDAVKLGALEALIKTTAAPNANLSNVHIEMPTAKEATPEDDDYYLDEEYTDEL